MKMKFLMSIFILMGIAGPQQLFAAGHEGNGGDLIEAFFISTGNRILNTLSKSRAAQKLLKSHQLSIEMLRSTLIASKIETSVNPLFDSFDQMSDALGSKDKITLYKPVWIFYQAMNQDVDSLVLHEMIRSLGRNDDNYVISNSFVPLGQWKSSEDLFRLSCYIEGARIEVAKNKVLIEASSQRPVVNDISRTAEVSFPPVYLRPSQNGESREVEYMVKVPVINVFKSRLILYRIEYIIESYGGPDTTVYFWQAFSSVGVSDVENENKDPFGALEERIFVTNGQSTHTEYLNVVSTTNKLQELRFKLMINGHKTDDVMVSKVILYYQIEKE